MNIRAFTWSLLGYVTIIHHMLHAGLLDTSTMRIANRTEKTVYCTFYYQQGTSLSRATIPRILPADNAMTIELPSSQLFSTRVLAISESHTVPQDTSTSTHSFLVPVQRVGLWQPSDITLFRPPHGTRLTLASTLDWQQTCERHAQYQEHAHTFAFADQEATVTDELLADDRAFLAARTEHVHQAQQTVLGTTLSRPLRIGIAASGGGFRAMVATIGLLKGLEKINLLDTVTSCAGLSGSTWALLSWLVSTQSVTDYAPALNTRLHRGLMHHLSNQYADLARIKEQKEWCGLPVSGIDLYGIGLSHTLLKPLVSNHTELTLADTAPLLDATRHPYLVSMAAARQTPQCPYTWLSFTPFSIYQHANNLFIPSWALGRTFLNGHSTNNTPPPLLGYCLGIFGSSFSVSVRDVLDRAPSSLQRLARSLLPETWQQQLSQATWANAKLTAAHLPNFSYAMPDAQNTDEPWLCIVDGGYLNNLPIAPLAAHHEEHFDIIIALDSRRERDHRLETVRLAYDDLAAHGHDVAPLTDEQVCLDTISISPATRDGQASLVYITLEPDRSFDPAFDATTNKTYATPNLFYTAEIAERLMAFVEHVVVSHENELREVLVNAAGKIPLEG